MTTLADIRAAIKTKLEAVASIGVVNDYERYAKDQSKLVAAYKADGRLKGWFIHRQAKREEFVDTGRWTIYNTWRIRGFMSLEDADATEKTFDDLVEAIGTAFRTDMDLGGVVLSCIANDDMEAGIQVIESGPVLFAGVLCHSAELGLTTQHLEP